VEWSSGLHDLPLQCGLTPPTVIRIEPSEKTCYLGQPCYLDVVVDNVTDLGAFEFTMDFDPGVLQLDSIQEGPFLGSTGRTTQCGRFDVGPGLVRYGCASGGSQPGPTGSGVVAAVSFTSLAQGDSVISLDQTGMYDPLADPIPHSAQYGHVTVSACYGDVDGDGDVDIRDVALVFAHWPSPPLPYDQRYDMDSDGNIDIRDVQLVFSQWPRVCEQSHPIGDINGDCVVDTADQELLLAAWGSTPGAPNWDASADLNQDGVVDIFDLSILLTHWGETCGTGPTPTPTPTPMATATPASTPRPVIQPEGRDRIGYCMRLRLPTDH
jgi:hypothetical protein